MVGRQHVTGPQGARAGRAWLVAALAAVCGCSAPAVVPLCQVEGELGAGAFGAHDCRDQPGCLDGWRFAARSSQTMIFCPASGQEVTEVTSSDPRVMATSRPVPLAGDAVTFALAAGEPGPATIEVRGPDLIERLALTVEDVGELDVVAPARVVVGGSAAVTSTKTGVSGAPMFGRGGYQLGAAPGLAMRAATTATQDCALAQPDVVLTPGEVGSYALATAAPAPAWSGTIDVVPAAAVTSARFTATRIAGSASTGYAASIRVIGLDARGDEVQGVACAWSSARPVFIAANVCWSLVLLSTDEPLDLECTFDGRALGTVRLSAALVL